ncbi:MAG: 23S rRNA (pseudouridine(1915)-N(3))-methyltransferase RlmH [Micavibrio aeruginosavorus]|uniref:Ribosomal RNA large subunit methyltransferase H n=1 Tax=Micavibrio aeruginosavorus TaxID=349221 RepID=A0A2W5MVH1_9BACT|nr:MAG: 23S rRNA (pseudouridine(1915)-N(3))-methyltransferase RlmH [Micavibrio aeruginosavorus]
MLGIEFITVGRLKNDPLLDAFDDYRKRLQWKFTLLELEGRTQAEQLDKITEKLNPQAALVVLDERGKSLSSRDFAAKIDGWQTSHGIVQFVIGGADGLSDDIRKKASALISFGAQTWPHMLARVMLIEQVYRAQQILAGHPYHRD